MKEQWSISKDKLVSIEDGLISNEETPHIQPTTTTDTCKKLIQCIKFILYLELVLFVGWGCYAMWQTYRVESMEVKVTDSIQESESRNVRDQRLHLEESTITPDEFLTQMENLLQAENTLTKAVDTLQKQWDEEKVNTVSKTVDGSDSTPQNERESDIKVISSPLSDINVPEMIVVDLEKDVPDDKSEVGSELSKSEENILEWTFGLLLFPGSFDIKYHSQISANNGPEQVRTTETLSESETDDDINSEEAERIIEEIAKALRDVKSGEPDEDLATSYQRLGADDSLTKMDELSFLPMPVMFTPAEEFDNPDSDKDIFSDEGFVDRTAPEDVNRGGLVHLILHNQEPIREIQDDFPQENPEGKYGDSQVDESTLLRETIDEGEESAISYPSTFVNYPGDDSQADQLSWMTTDELFVPPVSDGSELSILHGNTRTLDKRSISDVPVKEQDLWNNKQADNTLMNKLMQATIYNRVSNEESSLNTLTNNRRTASLLDSYIRGEENLLAQEIAMVPNRERKLLKNDLNNFFHKMEALASHIDKLHERYLYLHELNDDYVSEEFPSDNLRK